MPKYEKEAHKICEAIKAMAENEDAISNFEGYLSYHLPNWFSRFVTTPEGLADELHTFAHMYD